MHRGASGLGRLRQEPGRRRHLKGQVVESFEVLVLECEALLLELLCGEGHPRPHRHVGEAAGGMPGGERERERVSLKQRGMIYELDGQIF